MFLLFLSHRLQQERQEKDGNLDNVKTSQVNFDTQHKLAVDNYDDDGSVGYETDVS